MTAATHKAIYSGCLLRYLESHQPGSRLGCFEQVDAKYPTRVICGFDEVEIYVNKPEGKKK